MFKKVTNLINTVLLIINYAKIFNDKNLVYKN